MRQSLLVATLCFAVVILSPPRIMGGDFHCTGPAVGVTVDNLIVPPSSTCLLSASTVAGTIKVLDAASLDARVVNVGGSIQAERHRSLALQSVVVGGSIDAKNGGPVTCFECFARGAMLVEGNTLPPGGLVGVSRIVNIFRSTINGGVKVLSHADLIGVLNVEEVRTDGDIIVAKNAVARHDVSKNIADTGTVKIEENFSTFDSFMGENLTKMMFVLKNKGPGLKRVVLNTVLDTLSCFENDPPFASSGNVAVKREGQCAAP